MVNLRQEFHKHAFIARAVIPQIILLAENQGTIRINKLIIYHLNIADSQLANYNISNGTDTEKHIALAFIQPCNSSIHNVFTNPDSLQRLLFIVDYTKALQCRFIGILQQPVHLNHVFLMLQTTAHDTGKDNLAGAVIYLAFTHIDNTLTQSFGSFFQLANFICQLQLRLGKRIYLTLCLAVHIINLSQLNFHCIIFSSCFFDFSIKLTNFFILLVNLAFSLFKCSSCVCLFFV